MSLASIHPTTGGSAPPSAPASCPATDPAGGYVYLLVSYRCPAVFKLGITGALSTRLVSLRANHGEFDAAGSFVLQVPSRQFARELEADLQARFAATHWRAVAPRSATCCSDGDLGGYTEWYAACAFAPMLAALLDLLQRSRASAPGALPSVGMSLAEALRQPGEVPNNDADPAAIQPSPMHRENAGWLAYSETISWLFSRGGRNTSTGLCPSAPLSWTGTRRCGAHWFLHPLRKRTPRDSGVIPPRRRRSGTFYLLIPSYACGSVPSSCRGATWTAWSCLKATIPWRSPSDWATFRRSCQSLHAPNGPAPTHPPLGGGTLKGRSVTPKLPNVGSSITKAMSTLSHARH